MNIKKILIINVIIITIIYICTEFCFYIYCCDRAGYMLPFFQQKSERYVENYPPARFQPIEKTEKKYSKPPILMIGCSYTYGELLDSDNTPEEKLSRLTDRYVYNWGASGYGPIVFLSSLNGEHRHKNISVKPEYVIYTYMFHHIERYGYSQLYNTMRKYGLIPFQKYNFLYNSYIYQYYKNIELDRYFWSDFNNRYELFFSVVSKLKEECENLYPGSKFVILIYSDVNQDLCEGIMGENNSNKEIVDKLFEVLYSPEFRKRLEDMGITVISTEELIGRRMYKKEDRIPNDPNYPHPSSDAWDEILSKLVKKLNL